MEQKIERLIRVAYKKWKEAVVVTQLPHPGEEEFVCFFEGNLSVEENKKMMEHVLGCERCGEIVAAEMKLKTPAEKEIPDTLLERAKLLVGPEGGVSALEIILRLGKKALEVINTTGDVLVGQELVPAPVLRSRQIKAFKDEVTILKDFNGIRVEARIENKMGTAFKLVVSMKEKDTQRAVRGLRATLIKDGLELDSYLASSGRVIFEHVLPGEYTIEIDTTKKMVALICMDIKA